MKTTTTILEKKSGFYTGKPKLRLRDLALLSLRVFRVQPTRTLLTILGISLGIGTVLFLVSLGYGLQYILLGKLAATEDSLLSMEVYYPAETNLYMHESDVQNIKDQTDVAEVSPMAELSGEVKISDLSGFLLVKVVDPNYFRLAGAFPEVGTVFSEQEPGVVISQSALKLFNILDNNEAVSKNINLTLYYSSSGDDIVIPINVASPLPIKGVVADEASPPFVYVPSSLFRDKEFYYSKLFVKAKDIDSVSKVGDVLTNKGFIISARLELVNQARKTMQIITIILGIFGATALFVSAIGMFNTMIISFLERIFEIGIMKALGATSGNIRSLLLAESVVIGLLGGIGGVIVGVSAGQIFNFALNFLAKYLGGKPISLFIYPIKFIFIIIGISGFVGAISGLWPAHRAVLLSPKDAFARK